MENKKTNDVGYKQMIILIDANLLKDIKTRALFKNITLKTWILQAIEQARMLEDKYK